jgi:hypothetical protein
MRKFRMILRQKLPTASLNNTQTSLNASSESSFNNSTLNDLMNEHDNVVDKRIETLNSLHNLSQKTLQMME